MKTPEEIKKGLECCGTTWKGPNSCVECPYSDGRIKCGNEMHDDALAYIQQLERKEFNMLKAMLSQPMAGKTEQEIVETRDRAIMTLKERGYQIVNTLFTDEWYSAEAMKARDVVQIPLCFLAKSLENMSMCHAAYFCKGWENARGCRIEHEAAKAYGLTIIYEEPPKEG